MATPQTATATQLRNIEAKTGKTFAQLCSLIARSGLTKVGEQRAMLMEQLGLGYGDANTLALLAKQAAVPAAADADPLDAIYSGAKALPASARLKSQPPGGMCQYTGRLSTADDIDAELIGWIRAAYDAAG